MLACGNPLRQDDGVGWRIAEAAERMAERDFPGGHLRIVAAQQWTPEMAEELAEADLAIFVDASATDEPGAIRVRQLWSPESARMRQQEDTQEPTLSQKARQGWSAQDASISETHQMAPAELLALAEQVCGHGPARAFAVTVGAGSFQYGDEVSGTVRQAVPRVVRLVGNLLAAFGEQGPETGDQEQKSVRALNNAQ